MKKLFIIALLFAGAHLHAEGDDQQHQALTTQLDHVVALIANLDAKLDMHETILNNLLQLFMKQNSQPATEIPTAPTTEVSAYTDTATAATDIPALTTDAQITAPDASINTQTTPDVPPAPTLEAPSFAIDQDPATPEYQIIDTPPADVPVTTITETQPAESIEEQPIAQEQSAESVQLDAHSDSTPVTM